MDKFQNKYLEIKNINKDFVSWIEDIAEENNWVFKFCRKTFQKIGTFFCINPIEKFFRKILTYFWHTFFMLTL